MPRSHTVLRITTLTTELNDGDHEHNRLSIMFFLRFTLLIIIIITTSPLVFFAKMGSSEAGLFYSTWGTGLHERQLDD